MIYHINYEIIITIIISYYYYFVITIITFVDKFEKDLLHLFFHTLCPRMHFLALCVSLLLVVSPSKTDPLIKVIRSSANTTLFRINKLRTEVWGPTTVLSFNCTV